MLIVTDNASNMKLAWELVNEKHPHISTVGCVSHSLNLLLNDILKLKSFSALFRKAKHIIKAIKNSTVILAAVESIRKLKYVKNARCPKLPSAIRWGGVIVMFESLLVNKMARQETVIQEDIQNGKDAKQAILDDDTFWIQLKLSVELLQPVAKGITHLEADKAILSDVIETFHNITQHIKAQISYAPITKQEEENVMEIIYDRYNFTIKDIHVAAYLLDPRYEGKKLSNDDIAKAFHYISDQCTYIDIDKAMALANLGEYRTHTGLWTREAFWQSSLHSNPATWWKGLCTNQILCPLASNLLYLPLSSAACERNWSTFGKIHTKSRNRLKVERIEKIVSVRTNLKFMKNSTLVSIPDLENTDTSSSEESNLIFNIY